MQERIQTVTVQLPGHVDLRATKQEAVVRRIPTVYDFRMRKMGAHGPTGTAFEDGIRIIAGVGYNSASYDSPYSESKSGKTMIKYTKINTYLGAHRSLVSMFLRLFYNEKAEISSNISLQLSKVDVELRSILFKACKQLETRGPMMARKSMSKIGFCFLCF